MHNNADISGDVDMVAVVGQTGSEVRTDRWSQC